jgi:hypothetical protein
MATDPTPAVDTAPSAPAQREHRTDKSLEVDQNVARMFGFLEEWWKMDLSPLRDITTDSRVRWCKLTRSTRRPSPSTWEPSQRASHNPMRIRELRRSLPLRFSRRFPPSAAL